LARRASAAIRCTSCSTVARACEGAHVISGLGDFFGEIALLDGGPRSRTVTATTGVRAMKLPRRAFVKALEDDPRIGLAIMEELAGSLRQLEQSRSRVTSD
jgi:CRP-like cAMP-binding protein